MVTSPLYMTITQAMIHAESQAALKVIWNHKWSPVTKSPPPDIADMPMTALVNNLRKAKVLAKECYLQLCSMQNYVKLT